KNTKTFLYIKKSSHFNYTLFFNVCQALFLKIFLIYVLTSGGNFDIIEVMAIFYIIFLYNNFFILKLSFTSLYHFLLHLVNSKFYTKSIDILYTIHYIFYINLNK